MSTKYTADRSGNIFGPRGKKLKFVVKSNGYCYFSQSEGAKSPNQTLVHRFIWEYFNGAIPSSMTVDHIDGNKLNNSLQNLQLLSGGDNCRKHAMLLTESQAEEIRTSEEKGSVLAKKYNISEQLVCDIRKGRKYKCGYGKEKFEGNT